MESASKMLNDADPKKVAKKLGYGTVNSFYRAFYRHFGYGMREFYSQKGRL